MNDNACCHKLLTQKLHLSLHVQFSFPTLSPPIQLHLSSVNNNCIVTINTDDTTCTTIFNLLCYYVTHNDVC